MCERDWNPVCTDAHDRLTHPSGGLFMTKPPFGTPFKVQHTRMPRCKRHGRLQSMCLQWQMGVSGVHRRRYGAEVPYKDRQAQADHTGEA